MIVGDAFKLPSRDINYYRDLCLFWPFLLFSIAAIIHLSAPQSPAYRVYGFKLAACAVLAMILAREKLLLFTAALGFVAVRFAFGLAVTQDWRALAGLVISGGILFGILRARADWKPSYQWSKKLSVLDLLVGVASLGGAIALAVWMRP